MTEDEWRQEAQVQDLPRNRPIFVRMDGLSEALNDIGIDEASATATSEWINDAGLTITIPGEAEEETSRVVDTRTLFASLMEEDTTHQVRTAVQKVCEIIATADGNEQLWTHGLIDMSAEEQGRLTTIDTAKNSIAEARDDTVGDAWEATQMMLMRVAASKALNDWHRGKAATTAFARSQLDAQHAFLVGLNSSPISCKPFVGCPLWGSHMIGNI